MNTMQVMRDSRLRLVRGMLSDVFSYDRIISAANTFDLLPSDKIPSDEAIEQDLKEFLNTTKGHLREFPDSAIRNSILSAIGRAGKASLRSKIEHRCRVIDPTGTLFPDISLVVHHATLCRNHYVHGSPAGFNYEENSNSYFFLTRALEFIFSASDLIECGWSLSDYRKSNFSPDHDFSYFLISYKAEIDQLKRVVKK